jgi:hypothetical protein
MAKKNLIKKYKNISGKDLTIPGIGLVKNGETIELTDMEIKNSNFEDVTYKKLGDTK